MVSAPVTDARAARGSRPRDVGLAAAVALVTLVVQLPFRPYGTNLTDEGAILTIATELLRGRHLYSDVQHPAFPFVHWLTAAVFWLFGPSFETARTFTAVLFALTTAIAFLIARWFLARRGGLGFVVLFLCYRVWAYPHWQMVSYSSLAVTFVLAAAWIVGDALARPARGAYVAAGVVAGLAFITKQDSGAAGAAALALATLVLAAGDRRARWGAAVRFTAGGALVVGLAVIPFLVTGTLGALVDHTLIAPFRGLREFQYQGSPPLWPPFGQDPMIRARPIAYLPSILFDLFRLQVFASAVYRDTGLVDFALRTAYHLPWLVLLTGAARVVVRRWRRGAPGDLTDARETLLVFVAAAFWLAFSRPHDWIHLLVLYPPTLLLGTLLVAALVRASGPLRGLLTGGVTVLLAALFVLAAAVALQLRREDAFPVHGPRGTIYGTAPQARALQELIDGLATAPPGMPVVGYPYHPIVTFISARPLLGPYISVWPAEPDLHRTTDIVATLDGQPDGLVVYSPNQIAFFPRMAEYTPELFEYFARHYRIGKVFGGDPEGFSFFLLERKPPPGGRSLLGDALASADVTLEPGNGGAARPLTAQQRASWVGEALWPFAHVLRVTTFPEVAIAVRFRLTPAAGEHFRTAFGGDPDHWSHFPEAPIRFAVAVEPVEGPRRDVVAATVDPLTVPADRRWTDVDVDLTPWAGRPVDVVLRATGAKGVWPARDRAGWAEPRVE